MKHRLSVVLALALLVAGSPPLRAEQNFSVKEDIVVGKGQTQENIVSFGGNVTIEGRVRQSVVIFGGSVTVAGEVGDSVVGFGTTINLRSTAAVKKDVFSIGGVLNKEPGSAVGGDTVYFHAGEVFSNLFRGGLFTFPFIPLILVLMLIGSFIWLLIAIVVAALFPRQITLAASRIRASFWPVVGTGAVALLIFGGLVIFFALLSLVIIGIPFLLLLLALGLIIKIFGNVVIFYFFGESVARAFRRQAPAPMAAVILGLIVVTLIKLVPLLGLFVSLGLTVIAWGVAVRTKFGTVESWPAKRA
jgi:hypothetical protein